MYYLIARSRGRRLVASLIDCVESRDYAPFISRAALLGRPWAARSTRPPCCFGDPSFVLPSSLTPLPLHRPPSRPFQAAFFHGNCHAREAVCAPAMGFLPEMRRNCGRRWPLQLERGRMKFLEGERVRWLSVEGVSGPRRPAGRGLLRLWQSSRPRGADLAAGGDRRSSNWI